jgi:hypothetical protein
MLSSIGMADKKNEELMSKISHLNAATLIMTPLFIGLLGFILLDLVLLFSKPIPEIVTYAGLLWMSFWFILAGIGMILKKEIPRFGYKSIKGAMAIALGIVWIFMFGCIGIGMFLGILGFR